MEPLSLPTIQEQIYGREHRIGQRNEVKFWLLESTGEDGVSSETHVQAMSDVRKVFAEEGQIWDVQINMEQSRDAREKIGDEGEAEEGNDDAGEKIIVVSSDDDDEDMEDAV